MNKIQSLIAQHCPNGVEYKKLGEVCDLARGRVMSKEYLKNNIGNYPVYSSQTSNNGIFGFINTYDYDCESVTWTTDGAKAGSVFYHNDEKFSITNVCGLLRAKDSSKINMRFLFYILQISTKSYVNEGMGNPKLMSNVMADIVIPLPPLPVQEEIVRILDAFTELQTELQTELELRKKQYQYYRDKLLCFENIDGGGGLNVEYRTLGEIGEVKMCKRIFKDQTSSSGDIPFFKIGTFGKEPDAFISEDLFISYKSKYPYPKKGDILISASGTIGKTIIFDGSPSYFQDSNIVWIDNNEEIVLNKYLYYFYQIAKWEVSGGGTIVRLYNDGIRHTKIPLPPLEEQKRIVGILDRFDKLVNDISIGIPAEIEMRKKQYEYYRDRLLSFEGVC